MKISKIPNPDNIGEYIVFIKEFTFYEKELLKKYISDSRITEAIISFKNNQDKKDLDLNIKTVVTSEEDVDRRITKITVPNWVRNSANLERILIGDYEGIRPVTAEFVTTLNCNFRCVQCSYTEPKKTEKAWLKEGLGYGKIIFQPNYSLSSQMSDKVMEISLYRLSESGVRNILFTGGGEPLMTPVTLRGMSRAKRNGNIVALYTNGRLMNHKTIDEILQVDPLFVRISVYGGNQKATEHYTQALEDISSFQRVIENIETFARKKKEVGSKTNFSLSYLVHPLTSGSISDFAEKILKMKNNDQIDYIRFTPAVDYFFGQQHNQREMEEIFGEIEDNVVHLFRETNIKIKLYYHRLKDLNSKKTYDTCRASGWFVEVGPSGDVFLCCEKHFMPDYKIGDLTKQTLEDIWKSDLRRKVIKKVNDTNCQDCPTLCKPHELNKIFNTIENFRNEEMAIVDQWSKDLILYGRECGYCPGRLDDFQS